MFYFCVMMKNYFFMKRYLLLLLVVLFGTFCATESQAQTPWDGSIATEFAGGDGSNALPYLIETPAQLAFLAQEVNGGRNFSADKYFKLTENIDLGNLDWIAIGVSSTSKRFKGNFDGDGNIVFGLFIDSLYSYRGLFGYAQDATIKNLTITNSSIISDKGNVGFVCGRANNTTIDNCIVAASLLNVAATYVGGICGYLNAGAVVSNCAVTANITATQRAGGIVGYAATSNIQNCAFSGNVTGTTYVGGICGYLSESVSSACVANGEISGTQQVGGICGRAYNNSQIDNSINAANVIASSRYAGGVCGYATSTVSMSYSVNSGQIKTDRNAGSLCGYLGSSKASTVDNCFFAKQLSTNDAIGNYPDMLPNAGLLISEMTANSLATQGFSATTWTFTENMFPRITALSNLDISIIASAPALIVETPKVETVDGVSKDFIVVNFESISEDVVEWTSSNEDVVFIDNTLGEATISCLTEEVNMDITATIGDISKKINLTVTKLNPQIIITEIAEACPSTTELIIEAVIRGGEGPHIIDNVTWSDNVQPLDITNDTVARATILLETCGEVVTVIAQYTDAAGCESVADTMTFTVVDDEKPVIAEISPLTVICDAPTIDDEITAWLDAVTATDNCAKFEDDEITIGNNFDEITLPENGCGEVEIMFTAEDMCGNVDTVFSTIYVRDTVAPVFDEIPALELFCGEDDNPTQITDWLEGVSVEDNCDLELRITNNYDAANLPIIGCGSLTVTFTAVDSCGNTSSADGMIIISDEEEPSFEVLEPLEVSCSDPNRDDIISIWLASAAANDNCATNVIVNNNYADLSLPATGCGEIEVTFTAEDDCGNIAEDISTITLIDTIPPTFGEYNNFVSSCDNVSLLDDINSWIATVSANDNCGVATVTNDYDAANLPEYCDSLAVEFVAVDQCDNESTLLLQIKIEDNTAPAISGTLDTLFVSGCSVDDVPDAAADINELLDVNVNPNITISDNCTPTDLLELDVEDTFTQNCSTIVTRTYKITDICENSSMVSQIIVVTNPPFTIDAVPGSGTVSCPALAEVLPHTLTDNVMPTVTDNCGDTIDIFVIQEPLPVIGDCDGDVTYTYIYTDCAGNTATWDYTYTVEHEPLNITLPAGRRQVACLAAALIPPHELEDYVMPTIYDNCGGITTWEYNGRSADTLECEGEITYTYTYTDCAGNDDTWDFTYIVEYVPFTIPESSYGSSTVACASQALPPHIDFPELMPIVLDNCGNDISDSYTYIPPTPLSCEGSMEHTYLYADCEGNSATWEYIYTIEYEPFTITTPSIIDTVNCVADALILPETLVPSIMPTVTDNCGNDISSEFELTTTPNPVDCEGVMEYVYTYTDCESNTATWSYTYVVAPEQFTITTPSGGSTVSCPVAATVQPHTLVPSVMPTVTDNCGTDISSSYVLQQPLPTVGECEGTVTYTYIYEDCAGDTATWNYTYTVEYEPFEIAEASYDTLTVNCVIDALIQPNLLSPSVMPEVLDNCNQIITDYELTGLPDTLDCNGNMTYEYTYTDCEGNQDVWMFTYVVAPPEFTINTPAGRSVIACASQATLPHEIEPSVMPIVLDYCGNDISTDYTYTTPETIACEGYMEYVYTYMDCAGHTATWSYIYTIVYEPFTIQPASVRDTVACVALAVEPAASLLPTVYDNCGNNISSEFELTTTPDPVNCEGEMEYVYTYTDCAGYTATWSYIYVVEIEPFEIGAPAGGSTVACPADALVKPADIEPNIMPEVTDNCGNTLEPVLTNVSDTVDCAGSMTYTYTYTDCEGNQDTWDYIYTVVYQPFEITAENGDSTVYCLAEALIPPHDLEPSVMPVVLDNCQNTLDYLSFTFTPDTLECEGSITYTYTYEDCAGYQDTWNFVYTVDYQQFTIDTPAGDSTVNCAAQATLPHEIEPSVMPIVLDYCGNDISNRRTYTTPDAVDCEGDMVYTYTYMDCAGNTVDWDYTYHVDLTEYPVVPANYDTTVNCIAAAIPPAVVAVYDACGNVLTPEIQVDTVPAQFVCEGYVKYTYSYTDCALNNISWSYTYNIDLTNPMIVPANDSVIVACLADAVLPSLDEVYIYDACGNRLTPIDTAIVDNPALLDCEGERKYEFTYQDCAGKDTTWSYVYTINYIPFVISESLYGDSTVYCLAAALIPPHDLENADELMPIVLDNCEDTLRYASYTYTPDTLECEGDIVYTYIYKDCAGDSAVWNFTYTIDYQPFTIEVEADTTEVACVASALIPPHELEGVMPTIKDYCGNILAYDSIAYPEAVTCEGMMTYTYFYEDCTEYTLTWSYTYIVNMTEAPRVPEDGASTVSCIAGAVTPNPGFVYDACGNVLIPDTTINDTPDPLTCDGSGTREYVYTYLDCTGLQPVEWRYVYTIENIVAPILPPNRYELVTCIDEAQPLETPPTVLSHCGDTIIPDITSIDDDPDPLECQGTRVYTYTYVDCAGNSANWLLTYTIDMSLAPVINVRDSSAIVACVSQAVAPVMPDVYDACGRLIMPDTLITEVPNPVIYYGAKIYRYKYEDCAGNVSYWSMSYSIISTQAPVLPADSSAHVNCLADADTVFLPPVYSECGEEIIPVITYIDIPTVITCNGTRVFTHTYQDGAGNISFWEMTYNIELNVTPEIPFDSSAYVNCVSEAVAPVNVPVVHSECGDLITPTLEITDDPSPLIGRGTRVYAYTFTDCNGNDTTWRMTYNVGHNVRPLVPDDSNAVVTCVADAVPVNMPPVYGHCNDLIIPDTSFVDNPDQLTCNGSRIYTYTYTDVCDNTSVWKMRYTIILSQAPEVPANVDTTVNCPADVVAPDAGIVTDACGHVLIPDTTIIRHPNNIVCEGTVIYMYRYTDCSGNPGFWNYTYHVVLPDYPYVPANYDTTISCIASAIPPTIDDVFDACGNMLTPGIQVDTVFQLPGCEGYVKYTYSYVDCTGRDTTWTYTYNIEMNDNPVVPEPATATVSCFDQAVFPELPVVYDACDNLLTPVDTSIVNNYNDPITCEGTRVYTFTYADCAGNSSDWVMTYTVDIVDAPVIVTQDIVDTVTCIADAVDIGMTEVVLSACGDTINPVITYADDPGGFTCQGTCVYTYTYTDCAENSSEWHLTYHIILDVAPEIPTADVVDTVTCLVDAVPAETLPEVFSACGEVIIPSEPDVYDDPVGFTCEGVRVYTYTYTDCAGNSSDWHLTYHVIIDDTEAPVVPADSNITVACIVDAVPVNMPDVFSACGDVIVPDTLITNTPDPLTCEGTRTYKYTYTDCASNSTEWHLTYTIDMTEPPVVPADGETTVTRISDAVTPQTPSVVDQCGFDVAPTLESIVDTPTPFVCEGTRVYTYSYVSCAGDSSYWHYTYNIVPIPLVFNIVNIQDGCDNQSNGSIEVSLTGGEPPYTYSWINEWGQSFTSPETMANSFIFTGLAAGIYTIEATDINDCDNVISQVEVDSNPIYSGFDALTICSNDLPVTYGDTTFAAGSVSGNYNVMFQTVYGCDSLIVLALTVNQAYQFTDNVTLCDNDAQMPYQWHGISVTTTGTYYDSLYTTTHCDSVYILNFLINQTYTGTDDLTICEGELPYTYGDSTFVAGTTSGIYHVMFETVTGCDSLISLSLIVIETYIGNDDLVLCETSFPYAIGDTVFEVGTVEGTYLVHFNSAVTGCDSLVYTTLTINPTLTNTIYDTICQLERYTENNFNIFAYNYGMIYDTLYEYSAVTNCDSIVYLELTVDPLPADVGEIYGENNIAFNETGTFVYEYYVEPVEFATYYIWELNYAPWLLVQDSSNVCTVYFSSREVGTLTVTAYNDCGKSLNSSEFVISTLTGIEDYDNQAKMLIYPNPASDYINIEFDNVEGEISLTVTDDSGRVIDVFSEIISSDRKLINHSVKSYSSGVYYVNVKSKKVSITDKFVKLR